MLLLDNSLNVIFFFVKSSNTYNSDHFFFRKDSNYVFLSVVALCVLSPFFLSHLLSYYASFEIEIRIGQHRLLNNDSRTFKGASVSIVLADVLELLNKKKYYIQCVGVSTLLFGILSRYVFVKKQIEKKKTANTPLFKYLSHDRLWL